MSLIRCWLLLLAFCAVCINSQRTASDRDNCEDNVFISANILKSLEKIHQRLERLELQDLSANKDSRPKCHPRRCAAECPLGFNHSASVVSKCYSVVTQPLSWDAAQARCRELHPQSHLLVINSPLENQIISEILQKYECRGSSNKAPDKIVYITNGFWTSGKRTSDSCDSKILWRPTETFNQELSYNNWCRGEPNCAFNQEHCLSLSKFCNSRNIIGWNDNICSWSQCSVCEMLWPDD